MKRFGILLGGMLLISSCATLTLANTQSQNHVSECSDDSNWEISIQEWNVTGSFAYNLYHSGTSTLQSRVIYPQNQNMTIINAKYTLPNDHYFLALQYGQTGKKIKGRGSDTDWTEKSELRNYGTQDGYGDQKMVSFDIGKAISKDTHQRTSVFLGFIQQETTNETRNNIYHIHLGTDYGNVPQSDNGTYLNGRFRGIRCGLEREQRWSKWSATGKLALSALETKANGYWNEDVPRIWEDTGNTVGLNANLGVKYAITKQLAGEFGFRYNYARNYLNDYMVCDEVENGTLRSNDVVLGYIQRGFYLGMTYRF